MEEDITDQAMDGQGTINHIHVLETEGKGGGGLVFQWSFHGREASSFGITGLVSEVAAKRGSARIATIS